MQKIIKILFLAFLIIDIARGAVCAESWFETKGKHFIVYYESDTDGEIARSILQRAEKYYQSIGEQIGFTRYSNYWTWEERVKILFFRDQESFMRTTGQPAWSEGYSLRDNYLFESRSIITFKQEHEFLDSILPHEISHLILHDFLSPQKPPIWLDEGIAQLQEEKKGVTAQQLIKVLVRKKQHIPFSYFLDLDIRKEDKPDRIMIFYAQSLSVVQFMISQYGKYAFAQFCRYLRDGKSLDQALSYAFTNRIQSAVDLENKWVKYITKDFL